MRIQKIGKLYQLTPRIFPVNCFVYERSNSLLVIDMGVKGFVEEILKLEKKTGKRATTLLLTHAHGDHINGVPAFRQCFPEAKIGISVRDKKIVDGDLSLFADEAQKKIKGGIPKEPIPIDFTFQPGEEIDGLKVVACPGHTPGSVAFLSSEGLLIAGDAFQLSGEIAVAGIIRPFFPFPALATWDAETALVSAKALLELCPELLAVGHGSMLEHPSVEMSHAIEQAERRLKLEKNH